MIHTINISAETPEEDEFFNSLTMNRFPIVVFDDRSVDELIKDVEFQDVIKSYLKTKNLYLTSFIHIRTINNSNNTIKDRVIKVRDFMKYPEE